MTSLAMIKDVCTSTAIAIVPILYVIIAWFFWPILESEVIVAAIFCTIAIVAFALIHDEVTDELHEEKGRDRRKVD